MTSLKASLSEWPKPRRLTDVDRARTELEQQFRFDTAEGWDEQRNEDLIPLYLEASGDAEGYLAEAIAESGAAEIALRWLFPSNYKDADESEFASELKLRLVNHLSKVLRQKRIDYHTYGYVPW